MSATLWQRLAAAGLVDGPEPAGGERDPSPWFVRVMLGVAGWIGASFLLGFVGIGFEFILRNEGAALFTGAIVCAGAAVLMATRADSDFMTQFAIAVSFTGQGLLLFGFARLLRDPAPVALAMAGAEAALFFAAPAFLHRTWCAAAGAFALTIALGDWQAYGLAPALLAAGCGLAGWLEARQPAARAFVAPMGYGFALALMLTLALLSAPLASGDAWLARWVARGEAFVALLAVAVTTGVLVAMALALLARDGIAAGSRAGIAALAAAAALGVMSFKAPGLGPATLLLAIGFANGNRVMLGLGVLTLLGYLSHYYYALDLTLLQKSAVLGLCGAALLAARFMLRGWLPPETRDA